MLPEERRLATLARKGDGLRTNNLRNTPFTEDELQQLLREPRQAQQAMREGRGTYNALGIRSAMVAHRAKIKRWDLIALATERRDLLNFDPATSAPWPILDTPGQEVQPIALNLNAEVRADMHWTHWVQAFMDTHETLTRKVRMTAGVVA